MAEVSKRTRSIVSVVVAVAAIVAWNAFLRDSGGSSTSVAASTTTAVAMPATTDGVDTTAVPTTDERPSATVAPTGTEPESDLPVASTSDLPAEALDTLALIEAGGPFPYDQDDGVFGNREGLLPDRFDGYYREYTVETPGSDDRGARRIIVGDDGEIYYTDDHYESFVEVVDAHL